MDVLCVAVKIYLITVTDLLQIYVIVKTKSAGFIEFCDPPLVAIAGPDQRPDLAHTHTSTTFTVF